MPTEFCLDQPVLKFPHKDIVVNWTIRQAIEGVQIFGGIGSGKSSGSGRMLALKYLSLGFGGLVLTVKAEERAEWEKYCELANRSHDLLIVSPSLDNYFNFLDYECEISRKQKISPTQNLVQVLKTVIRASTEKSGGKNDDPFWETALDMLIANAVDLCWLAYNTVSVEKLYYIVQSCPKKDLSSKEDNAFKEAYTRARYNIRIRINENDEKDNSVFDTTLDSDCRALKFVEEFFHDFYLNLSEKTRSVVDFSFVGFLYGLLKDPIFSLFCDKESNFTPDDCLTGKIILIDLPVKHFHKIGRDSQILFKYIWQRAMERRNAKMDTGRPVFLWADEAQNFLHEHDAEYQATARSSRIATVYISQNLPNYYANMGGEKSEYRVKSFLGTLATKIFHANADIETNNYASTLMGEDYDTEVQQSQTVAGQFSSTHSQSYRLKKLVRPEAIVRLKTGGPDNDYCVEGYMHWQGKTFHDGLSFRKITFKQLNKTSNHE